jgi:hypothetical protein
VWGGGDEKRTKVFLGNCEWKRELWKIKALMNEYY